MPNGYTTNYDPICIEDGCDKKHKSRGYCSSHYSRFIERNNVERVPNYGAPKRMIPSYGTQHKWVYKEYGKPIGCAVCNNPSAEYAWLEELCDDPLVEQENVYGAGMKYCSHTEHYLPLCRFHHQVLDGTGRDHQQEPGGFVGLFDSVVTDQIPGTVIASWTADGEFIEST